MCTSNLSILNFLAMTSPFFPQAVIEGEIFQICSVNNALFFKGKNKLWIVKDDSELRRVPTSLPSSS